MRKKKRKKANRTRILVVLAILLLSNAVIAQNNLDKNTIYTLWTRADTCENLGKDCINKLAIYDFSVHAQIRQLNDSIKSLGVDTFGIFIYSLPGFISKDTCMNSRYPTLAFAYWKFQGSVFQKKITNNCKYNTVKVRKSTLIEYFQTNMSAMQNEYIMPAIYGATREKGRTVKYQLFSQSHDPLYTIYCEIRNNSKYVNFSESAIRDTVSIFYKDNLNLKLFEWYLFMKREVMSE